MRSIPKSAYAPITAGGPKRSGKLDDAVRLHQERNYAKAESLYRELLEDPKHRPQALNNLGTMLGSLKRYDEAVHLLRTAIKESPKYAEAYSNLSSVLNSVKETDQAIEAGHKAVTIDPKFAPGWSTYSNALLHGCQYRKALQAALNAADLNPDLIGPHITIAECSRKLSLDGWEEAYYRVFDRTRKKPGYVVSPFLYLYSPRIRPQDYAEMVFHYKEKISCAPRPPAKGGLKRIGFMSGDLNTHPVGQFLLPLVRHLREMGFELYAYHEEHRVDEVTKQLKEQFHHWRSTIYQTDDKVAEQIKEDGIDLIVDLAGLTEHTRMQALCYSPAPVTVGWLGCSASTGHPGIDYILADETVLPHSEQQWVTEKIQHLKPAYLAYEPTDEYPKIQPVPQRPVFFSPANPDKISEATCMLWGELLRNMPQALLRIKYYTLSNPDVKDALLYRLRKAGVAQHQVALLGETPFDVHLSLMASSTLCLDTYPYSGATTTCQALMMGVPVLTLPSDRYAGRQSASILKAANFPELVADSPEAYVQKAIDLVGDDARLQHYRSTMRETLTNSPLCDIKGFAENFAETLGNLWDQTKQRPAA
jgi:predicted O-linked N-acetylglucosamine transferase (SPINDLY family)